MASRLQGSLRGFHESASAVKLRLAHFNGVLFMRIAWIGTGIMGAPMARRLLKAGHHLRVFNRSAEKTRPLADEGAQVAADAAAAATGAQIIFIMVPDTPDVEGVIGKIQPSLTRA